MAKIIQPLEWDEIRALKPRTVLNIYIYHRDGEPAEEILGYFDYASQNADGCTIHLTNVLNLGEEECKIKGKGYIRMTDNTFVSPLNQTQISALSVIRDALTIIKENRKSKEQ